MAEKTADCCPRINKNSFVFFCFFLTFRRDVLEKKVQENVQKLWPYEMFFTLNFTCEHMFCEHIYQM